MNENFNQANDYSNYQNNVTTNYMPGQQQVVGQTQNQYNNNDFVYNDEGNNSYMKNKNNSKIILIIIGIVIIVLIIFLLLRFCGNMNGKLTGIVAEDEVVTYVNDEKEINFGTTGTGKLEKTVFTFKIKDDDIAELDNETQTGSNVENEVKGLEVGETTLEVVATLGKKEAKKDIDVIVCDRLDVAGIANDTITVEVGQTNNLLVDLGDDVRCYAALTFIFGVSGIAEIDDDYNIKGISAGTTTLTISDGTNTKELNIEVIDPNAKVLVSSIKVSPSSKFIVVGKSYKLKATVSPSEATNKKVEWLSEKTSVATVSQTGVVKAKKVGTTHIVVTALDGSDKTTRVKITVIPVNPVVPKPINIKVSSIKFSKALYETTAGAAAFNAGVIFTPTNATVKTLKECKSDDNTIATAIARANYCIVQPGMPTTTKTTKITAISTDGSKTATAEVKVSVASSGDGGGGSSSGGGSGSSTAKCYLCGRTYKWTSSGSGCTATTKTKAQCTGYVPGCYFCGNSQGGGYAWLSAPQSSCVAVSKSKATCTNSKPIQPQISYTKTVYRCTKMYQKKTKTCNASPTYRCVCSNLTLSGLTTINACKNYCGRSNQSFDSFSISYGYSISGVRTASCKSFSGGSCGANKLGKIVSVSCTEASTGDYVQVSKTPTTKCFATSPKACNSTSYGYSYTTCTTVTGGGGGGGTNVAELR